MDGTKILILMLMMSLFISISMDIAHIAEDGLFGETAHLGLYTTADMGTDDYVSFWGNYTAWRDNDVSVTNITNANITQAGTEACAADPNSTTCAAWKDMSSSMQTYGGAYATTVDLLAMLGQAWSTLWAFIGWVVSLPFAMYRLVEAVGLGDTFLLPLLGFPWAAAFMLLLAQALLRWKF